MIEIVEELPTSEVLTEYARIPIAYRVDSVLQPHPVPHRPGAWTLEEKPIDIPYIKDYDQIENPDSWSSQFDLSNWVVYSALSEGVPVRGTVLAWNTPGVDMLEGRNDLAVLWDLRVHPEFRRQGIGARLFSEAVAWAKRKGCRELKVETQDINVRACRLYAAMGCILRTVRPGAYPTHPDEVQFLWYREL